MNASRLLAVIGIIVVAALVVQAEAALTAFDPAQDTVFFPEASLPVLLGLAALIPFAAAGNAIKTAPRRRRVNRARLRARRAAA